MILICLSGQITFDNVKSFEIVQNMELFTGIVSFIITIIKALFYGKMKQAQKLVVFFVV